MFYKVLVHIKSTST